MGSLVLQQSQCHGSKVHLLLPVCVLPDLNENHTGVKPVEDEEGQRDSRNDSPSQQAVELSLDALGDVAVGHEGVEHPEGDVGEEEESDDLSPRFGSLLSACCAHPPTCFGDDHTWEVNS